MPAGTNEQPEPVERPFNAEVDAPDDVEVEPDEAEVTDEVVDEPDEAKDLVDRKTEQYVPGPRELAESRGEDPDKAGPDLRTDTDKLRDQAQYED